MRVEDVVIRKAECEHQLFARMTAFKPENMESKKGDAKEELGAKTEFIKLTSSRSGCVYTPPLYCCVPSRPPPNWIAGVSNTNVRF